MPDAPATLASTRVRRSNTHVQLTLQNGGVNCGSVNIHDGSADFRYFRVNPTIADEVEFLRWYLSHMLDFLTLRAAELEVEDEVLGGGGNGGEDGGEDGGDQ